MKSIMLPPSNGKKWPTLPTIPEEPSIFHMANEHPHQNLRQRQFGRVKYFYQAAAKDLTKLPVAVKSEVESAQETMQVLFDVPLHKA